MIELPFPPATLNPNHRPHWATKARAFKSYKKGCLLILSQYRKQLAGRDRFELRFCPPDNRRRDLDNIVAAFKAGIDALAEISGVDDSRFSLTIAKGDPRPDGAVVVS